MLHQASPRSLGQVPESIFLQECLCRTAGTWQGWFDSGVNFPLQATGEGRAGMQHSSSAPSSPDALSSPDHLRNRPHLPWTVNPLEPQKTGIGSAAAGHTQSFCPLAGFLFSTALSPGSVQSPDAQSLCMDHCIQCS